MSKKDQKKHTEKVSTNRDLTKLFHDVTSKMRGVVQSELSLTKDQLADVTSSTLINLGYQVPVTENAGRKG